MPAYNPPPQVLFSPVTNYYQGKAIRLQQQMQQKELDTYDDKLDLERRRVEVSERNASTAEQNAERARKEIEYKIGEEESAKTALKFYSVTQKHADAFAKAGRTPEALEETLKNIVPDLKEYAESLPDALKEEKAKINDFLSDGVVTQEELQSMQEMAELQARHYYPKMFADSEPTAKMKEAISMGYTPGTPEYESYLRGSGRATTLASLAVPIYEKMLSDPDYEPTEAEQRVLDDYTRASPLERLLAQMMGVPEIPEGEGPQPPEGEEPRPPEEIDVLKTLAHTVAALPEGADVAETIARFTSVARETYGVDISQEEAEAFIAMFPAEKSSYYPNASSGTINR